MKPSISHKCYGKDIDCVDFECVPLFDDDGNEIGRSCGIDDKKYYYNRYDYLLDIEHGHIIDLDDIPKPFRTTELIMAYKLHNS